MSSSAIRRESAFRRPQNQATLRRRSSTLKVVREQPRPERSRSRLPLLIVAVVALVALIVIPLLINTQLAVLSYQVHADQVELAKVQENNQLLQSEVNEQSSAERVRTLAEENGLVKAGETGYIQLSKGEVEGGTAATAPSSEEDGDGTTTANNDAHTQEVQRSQGTAGTAGTDSAANSEGNGESSTAAGESGNADASSDATGN